MDVASLGKERRIKGKKKPKCVAVTTFTAGDGWVSGP